MAYGLRAKADLKRPSRYSGDNQSEEESVPELEATGLKKSLPPSATPHSPSDSSWKLQPPLSPLPQSIDSPSALHQITALPSGSTASYPDPSMNKLHDSLQSIPLQPVHCKPPVSPPRVPRARNKQSNNKNTRCNKRACQKKDSGDEPKVIPSLRQGTGLAIRNGTKCKLKDSSIYPSLKPAAFPTHSSTLKLKEYEVKDATVLITQGQQYARRLMEAILLCDQSLIKNCEEVVDRLYVCKQPIDKFTLLDIDQYRWYTQLNQQWEEEENASEVKFESLWPSLRQVIIERIRDEFPAKSYYNPYFPVEVILELSSSELTKIMAENRKMWDDIPIHLMEYKNHHPDKPVDPDMPPAREIVKAIQFLRQRHLAGNLLGEWQMPLPPVKYFLSWTRRPGYVDSLSDMPSPDTMKLGMPPLNIRFDMLPHPSRLDMPPPVKTSDIPPMATPISDAFLERYQKSKGQLSSEFAIITGAWRNPNSSPDYWDGPFTQSYTSYFYDIEKDESAAARHSTSRDLPKRSNPGNLYRPDLLRAPAQGGPRRSQGNANQRYGEQNGLSKKAASKPRSGNRGGSSSLSSNSGALPYQSSTATQQGVKTEIHDSHPSIPERPAIQHREAAQVKPYTPRYGPKYAYYKTPQDIARQEAAAAAASTGTGTGIGTGRVSPRKKASNDDLSSSQDTVRHPSHCAAAKH